MLFDPFEEDFDLPPAFIKHGDGQCREKEIIGQKDKEFTFLGIEIFYTPELIRIAFQGFGGYQHDSLSEDEKMGVVNRVKLKSYDLKRVLTKNKFWGIVSEIKEG